MMPVMATIMMTKPDCRSRLGGEGKIEVRKRRRVGAGAEYRNINIQAGTENAKYLMINRKSY